MDDVDLLPCHLATIPVDMGVAFPDAYEEAS